MRRARRAHCLHKLAQQRSNDQPMATLSAWATADACYGEREVRSVRPDTVREAATAVHWTFHGASLWVLITCSHRSAVRTSRTTVRVLYHVRAQTMTLIEFERWTSLRTLPGCTLRLRKLHNGFTHTCCFRSFAAENVVVLCRYKSSYKASKQKGSKQ